MKILNWIPWILAICICVTEARYKIRRPLPPPPPQPPQLYKKSWPIGHRMSGGNTIHINSHSNFPPKRVPVFQKPPNFRRPVRPVFNGPPVWKNQIPVLSAIPNPAVLPQRQPVKEFQVMSKVPEYSPEYRPEPMALPPTHRGGIDDDKGPIHTIPAPNLSPADKPYDHNDGNDHDEDQRQQHHQYVADAPYSTNGQVPNYNYNNNLPTSQHTPSRPMTTPPPTQNIYEVTETNEVSLNHFETSSPNYYPGDFDSSRIQQQSPNELPSNDLYLNHPPISRSGVVSNNIQFPQQNLPMQTNLHSSLHVGFPSSAQEQPVQNVHIGQQQSEIHVNQPDLHVGHPAPAGPPLSATQLYDLLNSFPQQGDDHQQFPPQVPPQIIQQQLGQMFQGNPSFSQPQMHSFNYDEQANKRQQQILVNQNYASGRVTAGYNLHPDQSLDVRSNNNQELAEPSGQAENNIEFDTAAAGTSHQPVQNQYFSSSGNEGSLPTSFYTTLPNREAAEKLAALAAAGNVNSQLLGQLKKQKEETQGDEPLPNNHRVEYQVNEEVDDVPYEEERVRYRFAGQKDFSRQRIRQQQIKQEQEKADKHYEQQQRLQEQRDQEQEQQEQRIQEQRKKPEEKKEKQKPLRIMVPEMQEKSSQETYSSDRSGEDYDYENTEPENPRGASNEENYENAEFGSRLGGKSGK